MLAEQGQRLQSQIAALQTQIAQTTDPAQLQQLQTQLATLVVQAQSVQQQLAKVRSDGAALQRQKAALQRQGARLSAKGKRLVAAGRALQADSAGLTAQGNALEARGARLAAEGATLQKQGAALKKDAAALKHQKRRLERRAGEAKALKKELVRMLTDAGGDPLATDPRLVRLKQTLEQAQGVQSVLPPSVNASGNAVVMAITATTSPSDPVTSDLVKRLRTQVIPHAVAGEGITAYVGGITAAYDDLAGIISSRLPLVIVVVLALSFVVLLVAFRSVLVPLKAILLQPARGGRVVRHPYGLLPVGLGSGTREARATRPARCPSPATCR